MARRVAVVADGRQAGVDRPPGRFLDEVDDGVAEQGVGEEDSVGMLAHERRTRLQHLPGTGGAEEVTGEWPAVQGEDGELLDRHRRQRRDSCADGMDERRRHRIAADELLQQQGAAGGQLDESRPRLEVQDGVQLVDQGQRGRRRHRRDVDHGDTSVLLDGQRRPAGHDQWDVTGEQFEHFHGAVVAPVGVLDEQGVVAELAGDVGGDVGGWTLERPSEGVGKGVVGQVAELLETTGR